MVSDLLAVRCQPIKNHAGKFLHINMDIFLNDSGPCTLSSLSVVGINKASFVDFSIAGNLDLSET